VGRIIGLLTASFVVIAGGEGEAVGGFKNTINIKTEKLSCNIDRIRFTAVLDDL
jgi:hypothetical protein